MKQLSYGVKYPEVTPPPDYSLRGAGDAPRVNADGLVLVKGLGYVGELPTFTHGARAAAHVACFGIESWEKLKNEDISSSCDEIRENANVSDEQ